MSRIRRNKGRALAVAVAAVAVMAAVVSSAAGITVKSGIIEATFDGKISPTAFPKTSSRICLGLSIAWAKLVIVVRAEPDSDSR